MLFLLEERVLLSRAHSLWTLARGASCSAYTPVLVGARRDLRSSRERGSRWRGGPSSTSAWASSSRSPGVCPYALDVLVALPFLIDTAGNAANLYDSISSASAP